MRQRISRTDRNHKDLFAVVKQLDPCALDTHSFGGIGCDAMAMHRHGWIVLLEFKDPEKPPRERRMTENEIAMQNRFPDYYRVCMTTEDVVAALTL